MRITIEEFGLNEKYLVNDSTEKQIFSLDEPFILSGLKTKYCKINFRASGENAGGYITVNKEHPVVAGATAVMEICTPTYLKLELIVSAESSLVFDELVIEELEEREYLDEQCSTDNNVLVIVPDYPSFADLYLCAFAHSRNKVYQKKGLNIQVASIFSHKWYEMSYEIDGIPVLQGNYGTLKRLLSSRRYKTIVTHFVDENLFSIFDGYVYPTDQMIFICHGAESIYRYVENLVRPYFTKPITTTNFGEVFDKRDVYIKKYSQMENTEWVFVSEWLRNCAEEQHELKFLHSRIINNVINEERFPYVQKNAEDRKKILILRKYDNNMVHSVDQSVKAIVELSNRDFFKDLTFEVYGDGDYFDVLMGPIKRFENVHFHKTFIPNHKLHEVHREVGIALLPSRHDAHAVFMGECASSGLVVVGSTVTSNPYFMQQERFHTLAAPENPIELADIIERLYYNPDEFLKISKELSAFTRENFSVERTVDKEVELIKEKLEVVSSLVVEESDMNIDLTPVLSVVVLNGEDDVKNNKCKLCLKNHLSFKKIEIIDLKKDEGGYGEGLKAAIDKARGKYFKVIHGEDWLNSEQFSKLIEVLEAEDSDVVLTKGAYEFYEKSQLENMVSYEMLNEGEVNKFQNIIYPGYGFAEAGPILATSVYKTDKLKDMERIKGQRKIGFDTEWNAFCVKNIDTLTYYDLDIYRYVIERTETEHIEIVNIRDSIFRILQVVSDNVEYSVVKKIYIYQYIISPLVYRMIQFYSEIKDWRQMDIFMNQLQMYPESFKNAKKYIEQQKDKCFVIWQEYKNYLLEEIKRIEEEKKRAEQAPKGKEKYKRYAKKAIKDVLPYGVVRYIFKKR